MKYFSSDYRYLYTERPQLDIITCMGRDLHVIIEFALYFSAYVGNTKQFFMQLE